METLSTFGSGPMSYFPARMRGHLTHHFLFLDPDEYLTCGGCLQNKQSEINAQ